MRKEEKITMVIRREKLFKDDYFEGFMETDKVDFQKRILNNFEYIKRKDAENNPNYKQPIGYAVLINKESRKIFVFKRAVKNEDLTEKRLQGKWSLGVGGHIDEDDSQEENPIKESLLREIMEEVRLTGSVEEASVLGYINDEANSVGEVHFGILYLVEVSGNVFPKSREMSQGSMRKIEEVKNNFAEQNTEGWSRICLTLLEKII